MRAVERLIPHVVSPQWLAERIQEPDLRIVDVRWKLGDPAAGRRAYDEGHLPNAVFLDVDRDLAAPRGDGPGRHPLPRAEAFARTMERIGVGDATRVVAYDDAGGSVAARLWFLLRYFGHETGAVLDGGIQAWQGDDLALVKQAPQVSPARFGARARPELIVDREEVLLHDGLLIDARQPQRYRGESEPVDPRAGHIPGAKSAPFVDNLATAMGPFAPPDQLRAQYARLGARAGSDMICYCGSGVTACHDLLALELAGITGARLYEGSWSDWSSDPEAPIATGEE
jgi:thiosulfate/3-mercaptopyruvate sulfurtransferase